MNTSLKKFQEQ